MMLGIINCGAETLSVVAFLGIPSSSLSDNTAWLLRSSINSSSDGRKELADADLGLLGSEVPRIGD